MNLAWFELLDPLSGQSLCFHSNDVDQQFGYLTGDVGVTKWPVVYGIPFLRVDRQSLAKKVCDLIQNNQFTEAFALLLQDTDDFAPMVPNLVDCHRVAQSLILNDKEYSSKDMMSDLKFGRVADYFAVRGSSPTFFSGIGLLKIGVESNHPLIEVGCGIGHFLYWLKARGIDVLGTDTVFSKLCMAKKFLNIDSKFLVCAVAGKGSSLPIQTKKSINVFCHDVFYFIKNKQEVIEDFRRLAKPEGSIMIGHAHLANVDHGVVSGYPVFFDEYKSLALPIARFYDDVTLEDQALLSSISCQKNNISTDAEAISFHEGSILKNDKPWWNDSNELLLTPLDITWCQENKHTVMNWPNTSLAQEYRCADFLSSNLNPFEHLPFQGSDTSLPIHAGLAVPAPFFSINMKPVRWAIIGGGWITTDYFIPSFEFVPHAQLVALCDNNETRRRAFSGLNDVKIFSDWIEMLESCELDAVYIALPNHLHADIFEKVASFGLRILCEKPLATNFIDLQKIKDSTIKSPSFFHTAYDQRFHPAHIRLSQLISDGILGTVTQVRIHYACWVDGSWSKVEATDNWRIDIKKAGGGAGFDLLPHCLDLLEMILDDSVEGAHLMYQEKVHDYSVHSGIDDGALLSVKTQGGVLASLHVGYNCPENILRRQIEIIGTKGSVRALNTMGQDPGGELQWMIDGEVKHEFFSDSPESGPFVRQLDMLSRQWLRADSGHFTIDRDIELARLLVRCDVEAKNMTKKDFLR